VACCTASHWTAASLRDDYGLPAERVHVVGLGSNHEPSEAPAPAAGSPRFLFVGREWERKNGPLLLRAFARLREELPDARLDLVGGHPPVSAPGVTGHGPLRLDRPDEAARVSELFSTATCFVLPSEVEPFGLVYVEAALAGVPSIATTVGGAGTIVVDGTGLLVPPRDEGALIHAMRKLADPAMARRMGAAARERAGRFAWALVGTRLLRALGVPGGEDAEYL
jgi:glycosyltransferase involved in cell wall biosynthesis